MAAAAAAAEKAKQAKRRPTNGINGHELDDEELEAPSSKNDRMPVRGRDFQSGRSQSPAVHKGSISGASSGFRGVSPPRAPGAGSGHARDSFLNYFFGKDGGLPGGPPGALPVQSSQQLPGHRHVSQHSEPSFAASLRRGDPRVLDRAMMEPLLDEIDSVSMVDGPLMVCKSWSHWQTQQANSSLATRVGRACSYRA